MTRIAAAAVAARRKEVEEDLTRDQRHRNIDESLLEELSVPR
jgi:hypothetical protein